MNELTVDESQELEKCFYEMQEKCQQEIEYIDEILRPTKLSSSSNADFNIALVEATLKIETAISLAIRFYLEKTSPHDIYQLSTPLSKELAILQLTKDKFISDLDKEIQSLVLSLALVKSGNAVLHPTIFLSYHKLIKEILYIRPSTLFSMVDEVLDRLNR